MRARVIGCMVLIGAGTVAMELEADVVTDWNAALREAIQLEGNGAGHANPGWSTRAMAMMNAAIYDCVQAVDRTHKPFHARIEAPPETSKEAAAIQAAHDVASALYASQSTLFDSRAALDLATIPDSAAKAAGLALGAAVAQAYLEWRTDDGADGSVPYVVTGGPGRWVPDDLHPGQEAWGPAWGSVRPFCMVDSSQFQPPSPPALDSEQYAASYAEVKSLGEKESATRTVEQTEIGFFWAYDRAHLGPPPVLFNRNVAEIAAQRGTNMEQNARLFAWTSVAMADAAVAAWDCKFLDDYWRPITGIRQADIDGNPATEPDPNWEPLGAPGAGGDNFTPPFPAYVSGHATMGEAVFRTLAVFFGSDEISFTLTSEELPGVERHFTRLSQASDENARSRVYIGVHWDFDSIEGRVLGRKVADLVSASYFLPRPNPLSFSHLAGSVTVQWEGAGTLESSATLEEESWASLPHATSPFVINVGESPRMFFRLRR